MNKARSWNLESWMDTPNKLWSNCLLGDGAVLTCSTYARHTLGSVCQYKEDSIVSRPPSLFTSMRWPMHGMLCPKSQLKSTCLTAKFGSFLDHKETGEKGQNVISSSVQHPISLICAIHVSFVIALPMMWILLTKPIQKSVTTVCLHCSFTRLKNKHIHVGVLGTNVATISWLHWSPMSGYMLHHVLKQVN